jgi:UDP-N-acetylmuramoyl-L-alanyl-D-glutamate--2,6-diaminopimelate ligase
MVGVTGTNGKTTTTSLIRSILRHAGRCTEMIGTLTGVHTTPESPDLQRELAGFVATGTEAVVMEVSSHALALDRVVGAHFDRAVFTNLGRDHLDLHGTEEQYFAAKARLFAPELSTAGVANADDIHGRLLIDSSSIPMEGFSLDDAADVEVSATRHAYTWRGERIEVSIGAEFNVLNSLAAATVCASLGLAPAVIAAGLAVADPVPGRFESIDGGQPFAVIVDFAHTPEALGAALAAARRANAGGRLIVVFGAGGDRDPAKRAAMGSEAAERADLVVVTSDNPRTEDPQAIADAVVAGVPAERRHAVVTELDRRSAFAVAFQRAAPRDVVLIAGKGHERTQTIGHRTIDFDDRVVALEVLRSVTEGRP